MNSEISNLPSSPKVSYPRVDVYLQCASLVKRILLLFGEPLLGTFNSTLPCYAKVWQPGPSRMQGRVDDMSKGLLADSLIDPGKCFLYTLYPISPKTAPGYEGNVQASKRGYTYHVSRSKVE